jgi:hypothetical protein
MTLLRHAALVAGIHVLIQILQSKDVVAKSAMTDEWWAS